MGDDKSIEVLAEGLKSKNALFRHEIAYVLGQIQSPLVTYCLGQIGDPQAIPVLSEVLTDLKQEPIVRHEAGEALGAIGDVSVLQLLQRIRDEDQEEVVIDTCKLAVARLEWIQGQGKVEEGTLSTNPYASTDPAPPATESDPESLKVTLLNDDLELFKRYRAMFALR